MTDSSLDTPSGGGNGHARLSVVLVLLCALLPFAGVRHFDHVWDDHVFRGPASLVADASIGWGDLLEADLFDVPDAEAERSGFWRPAALLSFRVEALLAGGSHQGYLWLGHVVTWGLHVLASLTLLGLLTALGLGRVEALIGAALFALHPVHAEPVSWISGRMDVGATAAGFAALWVSARGGGRSFAGATSLVALLLLGMLFKESGALFLGLFTLLALARGARWRAALGPPALSLAIYLGLRLTLYGGLAGVSAAAPTAERWWTALSVVPSQLRLLIWPGEPTPVHPVLTRAEPDAVALAGIVALLLLVVCCVNALRRRELAGTLAFGVLALGLLLVLPWVGQRPATNTLSGPLNERFLYALALAPCVGIARLVGATGRCGPRAALALVLGLLVVLTPITAARTRVWANDESFARAALRRAPGEPDLSVHLGDALLQRYAVSSSAEDLRAALSAFETALSLRPDHLQASVNRFICLQSLGALDELPNRARALLKRWPDEPLVLYNLAVWHAGEGRLDRAEDLLTRDLGKPPRHPLSRSLLLELRGG